MVNWEDIWSSVPGLGIFLILPMMMYSMIALAPFGAVGVVVGMVGSEGALVAFMRISRWVIVFYAMKIKHTKCRPTATKPPYGWKWPGPFIYRWGDPPGKPTFLPNYRFQNGHMGAYKYKLKVDWVKNPITHPMYNHHGLIRNMIWLMEFPWPTQMTETSEAVAYHKAAIPPIPGVSWANLHEIMPSVEYLKDPGSWNRFAGKPFMVPFVEPDDFSHTPWFEVTDSSGRREAVEARNSRSLQSRRMAVMMIAAPKGAVAEVPTCPEEVAGVRCDEPLTREGGTAFCPRGHRFKDDLEEADKK